MIFTVFNKHNFSYTKLALLEFFICFSSSCLFYCILFVLLSRNSSIKFKLSCCCNMTGCILQPLSILTYTFNRHFCILRSKKKLYKRARIFTSGNMKTFFVESDSFDESFNGSASAMCRKTKTNK